MSAFKDLVKRDIENVFLNPDEFAEEHIIDGKTIIAVVAPDQNINLSGGYSLGLSGNGITVHAKTEDLPPRRSSGDTVNVDGRQYIITSWNEHMGMSELVLTQNKSF